MTRKETLQEHGEFLSNKLLLQIKDLADTLAQCQELSPGPDNPLVLFGTLMQEQGRGIHLAGGLILSALIAWRYHQHEITPKEFDSAKGTIIDLGLQLVDLKRQPKRRG